jgi:hypothetical protein
MSAYLNISIHLSIHNFFIIYKCLPMPAYVIISLCLLAISPSICFPVSSSKYFPTSVSQSLSLPVYHFDYFRVYQSLSLYVYKFVSLSIFQSLSPLVCQFSCSVLSQSHSVSVCQSLFLYLPLSPPPPPVPSLPPPCLVPLSLTVLLPMVLMRMVQLKWSFHRVNIGVNTSNTVGY